MTAWPAISSLAFFNHLDLGVKHWLVRIIIRQTLSFLIGISQINFAAFAL